MTRTPGFSEELIDSVAWEQMLKVAGAMYKSLVRTNMRGGMDEFYARLVAHIEFEMAKDEMAFDQFESKEYYEVVGARWVFDHIDEAPETFNREQFLREVEERFKWEKEDPPAPPSEVEEDDMTCCGGCHEG